jgi:hypothetical protein
MRTASPLALALLLAAPFAACKAPERRIPFQDPNWHAVAFAGPMLANQFVDENDMVGVELVLEQPGTGGWAFEVGARYAWGEGDGERLVRNATMSTSALVVDSEREADFYEFAYGVRQTYRADARFQPYFGLGGVLVQVRTEEHFVDTSTSPGTPRTDHERGEIRPGFYMRSGLVWNLLSGLLCEDTEFPLRVDVRGVLSVDYSYAELTLGFGVGK